jgi:hypothetical protein
MGVEILNSAKQARGIASFSANKHRIVVVELPSTLHRPIFSEFCHDSIHIFEVLYHVAVCFGKEGVTFGMVYIFVAIYAERNIFSVGGVFFGARKLIQSSLCLKGF